jgi:hypothetical protein
LAARSPGCSARVARVGLIAPAKRAAQLPALNTPQFSWVRSAKTGYDSQQASQPAAAGQHGNLWQPGDAAAGTDHGAHGEFDGEAHPRSS